jgi:ABC-type multidrug transport system ATPase subunit
MSQRVAPFFSAEAVTRAFGAKQVLKSASLWAYEGRITALLGRNGCGKSTLLKIGVGLVRADQGTIHCDGRVFQRPRLPALARLGVFYLPDRELLSRRLTLRQQFEAAEWHSGLSRTAGIIERLEIGDRLDQDATQLSGGERRRAEVALAWIRAPKCLLADEPFAEIDPVDREVIAAVLLDLARQGSAVVITGHEVPELLQIADDVVWMTAGTTHGLGTPDAAAQHDQFRREYLGPGRRPSVRAKIP